MRRTPPWIPALAAVVIVGGLGLIGAGLHQGGGGSGGGAEVPAAATSPAGPTAEELAAIARAKQVKALDAALKKYAATVPDFSVAVLDKNTGERYSYRGTTKYDTASIVKVQILACLLLHAQAADRDLTSSELSLAKRMIRLSDNAATTELFRRVGTVRAVTASNKRLGLTQTVVNSSWGFTRTTADDQVTLLAELVDPAGPLDEDSRDLAFTLMNTVDDEQDWGVPAAARTGETSTVKNGWDTRRADNGLWVINSVGRITESDDVNISIAVLSHDNRTMPAGIAEVEKIAKMTRQYLKY